MQQQASTGWVQIRGLKVSVSQSVFWNISKHRLGHGAKHLPLALQHSMQNAKIAQPVPNVMAQNQSETDGGKTFGTPCLKHTKRILQALSAGKMMRWNFYVVALQT